MAQHSQNEGGADPAPVTGEPSEIRNVVLVGHSGAGKTALVEALLAATGTVDRPAGAGGTEAVRQRSAELTCTPLRYDGIKVNLLDTPGSAEFADELRAGLRAADAALFVVSAAGGMDAATVDLWEECAALDMPRVVAVSRLDHPKADFDEAVALSQRLFGDNVLPLHLTMLGDDGVSVAGLLELITRRVLDYTGGLPAAVREPEPEHLPAIGEARDELIETILAESEDETLLDRYIDGEEIAADVLIDDLETAVTGGHFYPVVPVCAETGVGVDALLEVLTGSFPSPLERDLPVITGVDGSPRPPLLCDPDGPLVAEVVKTTVDPQLGKISLVRVFSGTLRPDQTVYVSGPGPDEDGQPGHGTEAHLDRLHLPLGETRRAVPACVAGDICVVTGVDSARAGDTISAPGDPLLIEAREADNQP
ncbi:small GTP-binding protein [Micromonospora pisi]|uniref:Small GTP-binding protein n=1 Tax=Micromonospora pisi TaxID=589240 RepID=A0A495JRI8_9ACTN|nr:small GTP-binding protein [Micromonospora pisi]